MRTPTSWRLTPEQKLEMLTADLEEVLEHARHVFSHYSVPMPKLMLAARDPAHPNMILVVGNDEVPAFAEQLAVSNAR